MPTVIAIVVAVIAIAVAIGAWFRPAPKPEAPAAKTYSEQEVTDAKKAVCEAFAAANKAVQAAGRRNEGTDSTAILAVAANVRLALTAGSSYMLRNLEDSPATPDDLVASIKKLADTYEDIAIAQLGEAPQDQLDPLYKAGDEVTNSVKQACG
ncbi:hypothetical protein ACXDF8_24120 [Mycolicibacterium sp. CBM1]